MKLKKPVRRILTVALTISCVTCGYGFYKMTSNDWISAIAFGLGLTGVMQSFLRQIDEKPSQD